MKAQSELCKIIDAVRRKICSVTVYPIRGSFYLREVDPVRSLQRASNGVEMVYKYMLI